MPRPRIFPEKIYVLIRQDGSLGIVSEHTGKELMEFYSTIRVMEYSFVKESARIPRNPLKAPKPAQVPTVAPTGQDTQPQGQAGGIPMPVGSRGKHRKVPSADGYGPPLTD